MISSRWWCSDLKVRLSRAFGYGTASGSLPERPAQIRTLPSRRILAVCLTIASQAAGANRAAEVDPSQASEEKAIAFLSREVPAWSKENGCFSCHNNGDGARALFLAASKGHRVASTVLADSTAWLARPTRWDENKGDPGFSDKNLADVQFTASLADAYESAQIADRQALNQAAQRLMRNQASNGSWRIEPENVLGSPTTWGTPLATLMSLRALRHVQTDTKQTAITRARSWLTTLRPGNTLAAATIILAVEEGAPISAQVRSDSLKLIASSQTSDGGWGPYADSPPEPFDTALVLIALSSMRENSTHKERIGAGRRFLLSEQEADGSWTATTRPRGGESYAQKISTTAWVTIALLSSR